MTSRCALALLMVSAVSPAAAAEYDCVIEPARVADVGSAGEGLIEEVLVSRGDIVEAGQPLARLDSELEKLNRNLARLEAGSQTEIQTREARLRQRELETERASTLFERRVSTQEIVDSARIELEVAELELKTAERRRELAEARLAMAEAQIDRRTTRSPFAGVVTEIHQTPGEFVHEQAPLMTVAAIDELNVEVFVPISEFGRIEVGQVVEVRPIEPIGGMYKATVSVVNRVLDAASGTFGVRLTLPNDALELPAGVRCYARFG